MKLRCYLSFSLWFESESSETLDLDSVSLISWLEFGTWPVILFFFFWTGSESLNSFSFLLNFASVIAFGFVASSDESDAWIAEMKAQWWRFTIESLRAIPNSIDFACIQFWKKLGFMKLFLSFLNFVIFDLTEWRENVVLCLWCGADLWWFLTHRAFYRLPCRLNWPAWHPGTNLQFYENVGLKRNLLKIGQFFL